MGVFLLSLAILDVILVLLVTLVAFLGRRPNPEADTTRTQLLHIVQRARIQFGVVSAAWTLVLAGHLFILVFDVTPERAEIYLLIGQAILLLLALIFEIGLYGGPTSSTPETPAQEHAP